jgi:hypothetical protein
MQQQRFRLIAGVMGQEQDVISVEQRLEHPISGSARPGLQVTARWHGERTGFEPDTESGSPCLAELGPTGALRMNAMVNVNRLNASERTAPLRRLCESVSEHHGIHTAGEGNEQASSSVIEQLVTSVRYRVH